MIRVYRERPDWGELLLLPVLYFGFEDTGESVYSFTNPVIPQMIFLGREALDSPDDLEETIVHELSHVWMGLLNEVSPLVDPDDESLHVLPSGTKGKSTLGVLLAAHFAASAAGLHLPRASERSHRFEFLQEYLGACLPLLDGHPALTDAGRSVWRRLGERSAALSRVNIGDDTIRTSLRPPCRSA